MIIVALFVSAWIETLTQLCTRLCAAVALFVSAWIETAGRMQEAQKGQSHSS